MAITPIESIPNTPAKGVPYFTPEQNPPAGTAEQAESKELPTLFQPLKIRGVEFQNRIWLAPLCQYSAENGRMTDWHVAHLGGIISRGPALSFIEATAVLPEGRITPEDVGLWEDEQIPPIKRVVDFAHSQGQKIGIQLAHAGRKASTVAPFLDMALVATEDVGGWPDNVWGPTGGDPWNERFPVPKELTIEGIEKIKEAFVAAAKRAVTAGFDVIQIHNAHGYLLHSFVSPAVNKRTDKYGGSFENRVRLTLEIVEAVRAVIPESMPLLLRISATDWLEESLPNEPSWTVQDTARLAPLLAERGVDLIDISSGGNHKLQKIKPIPFVQASFAEVVRKELNGKMLVSAVGGIKDGKSAQAILDKGQADAVFVGRHFQKNPGAVWQFAEDLGVDITLANQISWGFKGRGSAKKASAKI